MTTGEQLHEAMNAYEAWREHALAARPNRANPVDAFISGAGWGRAQAEARIEYLDSQVSRGAALVLAAEVENEALKVLLARWVESYEVIEGDYAGWDAARDTRAALHDVVGANAPRAHEVGREGSGGAR